MALTLGDLVAYLRVDDSDFQSKVNRSESRWSKLSSGLATGAKAIGIGAVAAIGAAGAIGISTASQMEQANIGFTTMLGSAEKARSFLGDLQQFAASTPFEFPELQTAASSLISVGIKADDVIPIMRTLGDVTSGMGTGSEGIQRATVALQQMTAAGKIQAEDLNQLRDAGIPVYDLLAAALGKTKSEVADLASKGKLGQDALNAMMKALTSGAGLERFSGLMDKQSQSLAGLWSTVKDTFGQGMATAIAPLIPMIKEGLGGAISFLSGVMPRIAAGLQAAVSWLTTFGTNLKGVFDILVRGDFSGSPFGWAEDSTAVDILFRIRDAFIALAGFFTGTVIPVFGAVGSAILSVTAFIAQHQAAAIALGVVVGGVLAVVAAAWIAQGAVATANSIRSVVAWFATATASTTAATIQSRSTAQIVTGWLLAGAAAVLQGARIAAVWTAQIIASAVRGAASFAVSVARVVAGWVVMGVQSMIQAARMAAAWFIALGPVGWVIATVVGLVALIVANWDKVKRWTSQAWAAVTSAVSGAWRSVSSAVSSGISTVVSFVRGLPGKVLAALGNFGSLLYSAGRALLQGLWNGISGAAGWLWGQVRGWASGLMSKVKGLFGIGSPSKVFADYGGWLMQGMAQGIAGGSGHAVNAALSAAGQVGNALQVAPGSTGIGAAGATGRGFTAPAQRTAVRVYIGDRELTDIVRVETGAHVDRQLGAVADQLHYAGA